MHIGIFGAGSIGCYVGGMLAANGAKVTLLGRPSMAERLSSGLTLTRHDGLAREVPPENFTFSTEPESLRDCDVILVCVKSGDTAEAGRILTRVVASDAIIVSLQNGVSNAGELRAALPGHTVLAAMVPFNIARIGETRFHCATEGTIVIEAGVRASEIVTVLNKAGIATLASNDIQAVLWGKLAMNLNNAVNVLSGLPLKAQLSDRNYRRVLAASVSEALTAMRAAGIKPARIGKVRPQIIPLVLLLPDWLFRIVAANMLKIDEEARSSMAEDLDAGRKPEIDYLNGEIVRLGEKTGTPTPVNRELTAMIRDAFEKGQSPWISGEALVEKLRL